MKKELLVEGMQCSHCQASVKKALENIEGVETADVSLETGRVVLSLSKDVADSALMDAVTEAGFTPKPLS